MVKVVPTSGWLATSIVPPCASTIALEIARPSPVLPEVRDGVRAIKPFEQVRQILRRNPPPRVADGKHRHAVLGLHHEPHFAAPLVVLDGIGQKVGDDLRDAFRIADTFKRRQFAKNLDVAFVGQGTNQFDAIAHDL